MDNNAIKAYSGVIADAAEDSEPEKPVQYTEINDMNDNMQDRSTRPPPSNKK